ncbi:hypothetical protein EJ08DRAFT_575525, partial [Tothia fuscella]
KCPIIHDGRIPLSTTLSTFDTKSSPFSPDNVRGPTPWSQTLAFPAVTPSHFDAPTSKPIQITINEKSIFTPGTSAPQNGFRRAGLVLKNNNGNDGSNTGTVTFHWSVKIVGNKALNYTHEYLNVWHETNDYNANQFSFQTGKLIGRENEGEGSDWKITDRAGKVVWRGKRSDEWQNFGVGLDYGKNTMLVYHSTGDAALTAVTKALPNNNAGGGQLQIGILKKPTGGKDVVHEGFQSAKFEEALVYGGIFIEDSKNACVSL